MIRDFESLFVGVCARLRLVVLVLILFESKFLDSAQFYFECLIQLQGI